MRSSMPAPIFCAVVFVIHAAAEVRVHAQSPDQRPNVLWIIADDVSPELGCYGEPLVKTPNLDRLAGEGMRFTRAFATCPVCSPARSALVTGTYQTTIAAHHHRTHNMKPLPSGTETVMQHFRRAGYWVSNQGKTDYNFLVQDKDSHPITELFDGSDWRGRQDGQPFFAQNYMPDQPYTQFSGYKKLQYPVLTLLHELQRQGQLTAAQAVRMAKSRPAEELYDLQSDPYELSNLADDPTHAAKLAEMREHLEAWIKTSNDQGAVPEGNQEYIDALMIEKRAYYENAMKRRKLDPNLSDVDYLKWWTKELLDGT